MGLIERTIERVGALDRKAMGLARARQNLLTKPRGSLGRLEEISVLMAGITGKERPKVGEKAIVVFAGDHGVVEEGVSAYPQEVTKQMVRNFIMGGAAINVIARHVGAKVLVVDIGIKGEVGDLPGLIRRKIRDGTGNMALGPAMSREDAVRAIEVGIEIMEEVAKGLGLVAVGDMGIGNTTPSSAICSVFLGVPPEDSVGRGTGLDDEGLRRKIEVVRRAIEVNMPDPSDPIDVLSKVGGFEIGGIAGAIIGAAANRIPVLIDGFISGAGALIASALCPRARDFMIAGHVSAERGHKAILEHLGLIPILDLGMRLGEGTGAALAMAIVEAATRILDEMATFSEAGVSEG